jgi:hypothetical protein
MPANPALPFSVNFWGSHPDLDNDDCFTGASFATLVEAQAAFDTGHLSKRTSLSSSYYRTSVEYVEIDGPGFYELRRNPAFKASRTTDREWQREIANEAGMCLGIDAYNDAMGC